MLRVKVAPDELLDVLARLKIYLIAVLPGYIVTYVTNDYPVQINTRTEFPANILHPSIAGAVI